VVTLPVLIDRVGANVIGRQAMKVLAKFVVANVVRERGRVMRMGQRVDYFAEGLAIQKVAGELLAWQAVKGNAGKTQRTEECRLFWVL